MFSKKALTLSYLFLSMVSCVGAVFKNRRRIKRFGVRPMIRRRDEVGAFACLIRDMLTLEWDEEQFIKYTRMTEDQFSHLHNLVKPYIKKKSKKKAHTNKTTSPKTLHYLSEGCSMQEIAWNYRTGKATAHNIIKETCEVLWHNLSPTQLPIPTKDDFDRISKEFFNYWNIPNCIGAIVGKHIIIRAPKKSGSEFFNYKQSFSIVLMACCDAFYRFTIIDIGASGGNHDSTVFKESGLGHALLNGQLEIPAAKPLPKINSIMEHFVVADAYAVA